VGCQSLKNEFPEFPLSDEIINNLDGTCTVSTKWINQLKLYQIEIENTEKNIVPEIEFPEFPPIVEIIDNLDGTCTVPTKWIIQLRLYQIEIEKTQKDYEGIKSIYNE
jgi:hypothetical protein